MAERVVTLPEGLTVDADLDAEFEVRLRESSTLAFRVAYAVLRHREDAEDVAQEAFAKAYRDFRQLRDRDRFRAWLVRLTWRLALDRRRSDRRRTTRELAQSGVAPIPASQAGTLHERAYSVWEAIDTLPERLRLIVVLSGIEGHNHAEVARLLGVAVGTVKSRMNAAHRRLRERLQCTTRNT
jgi:RNA polymerase sigma-70 factor (ECF subfamily)